MPNSLRSKIKHLAYKGEFNEREMDRLLSALDHELDVTYICDGKKCPECSKLCNHTTDISHAVNFEPVMFIDGKTILNYEEKMPRYKSIILQEHDAEPRTLRAILDTETNNIYILETTKGFVECMGDGSNCYECVKGMADNFEAQPTDVDCISREEAIRIAEQGQIQGFEWQFKQLCNLPSVTPISDSEDKYDIGYNCGYADAMCDIAESEDENE